MGAAGMRGGGEEGKKGKAGWERQSAITKLKNGAK